MYATIDNHAQANIVLDGGFEFRNFLIFGRLGGRMIMNSGDIPLTLKVSNRKWKGEAVLDKYSARIMAYEIDVPYLQRRELDDKKEIGFKFKEKDIIDFDLNIAGRKNLRSVTIRYI